MSSPRSFPARRARASVSVEVGLLLLLGNAPPEATPRSIAVRVQQGLPTGPELDRLTGWARREGIAIEVRPESVPVARGWEAVYLSELPVSDFLRRAMPRFPLSLEARGFVFDGRTYRTAEDGILISDPSRPAETFVLGNSRRPILRLLRRLFRRDPRGFDFVVLSGELSKEGRFVRNRLPLAIDRTSERDQIAAREEFFRSLRTADREGARWRFRDSEAAGVARWEPVWKRFRRRAIRPPGSVSIRLFPDPSTKARYTGSSRPADLSRDGNEILVDVDVSAPAVPDLVSPVIAAAAEAAEQETLLSRPTLLLAWGAHASGTWWGRDVAGFAAFVRQAGVAPSVEEVLESRQEVSPVLAVGAAASWLEAGVRADGEATVLSALAGPEAETARALHRWSERAAGMRVSAPKRRPLPSGFLRGISYAMSNSIDDSYASPRSRETLERLAKMSVNSVSVMPFAFTPEAHRPALSFVHRHPSGETDEGTVRAVTDARALGMSAMVKPQIWLPGAFVGELAMATETDWARWFDLYRRFLVHNAVVSEASGAALYCVGTELSGTEARVKEWRETIAAVRLATGAALLYASNWAAGAPRIAFWDTLDAIGVDFYDPLSQDPAASDLALAEGVRRAAAPLGPLAQRTGKPVIFAEAGYPPVRGAWITPHDENSARSPGAGDAARAIAVVFRALERESWWKGVYWWKAFSDGRPARPESKDFNVLGRPSERAIADGFERLARERGP